MKKIYQIIFMLFTAFFTVGEKNPSRDFEKIIIWLFEER